MEEIYKEEICKKEINKGEKIYAYWLCNIPGIGNRTIGKLLEQFGSAEAIYHASETELAELLMPAQAEELKKTKCNWGLKEEYEKLFHQKIQFILRGEAVYPRRLSHIPDALYGIFLKGHLPAEDKMSVAIIGARDCSEYGRYVAEALGRYLGAKGVQVISGMARGIDGISQGAALAAGGASYAVLGNGVDICYPARNRALYEQIQKQGGILSIYPPGTAPRPQNFPPRNRIVSGLADVVVVIEARQRSGTLITVDMALEQGKEVYVVPGRITDRLSDGCNRLVKQGAGILLSPEEFLEEITEVWERQRREERTTNAVEGMDASALEEGLAEHTPKTKVRSTDLKSVEWKSTVRKSTDRKSTDRKSTDRKNTDRKNTDRKNIALSVSQTLTVDTADIPQELQPVYEMLDFSPQSLEQLLTRLPKGYTVASLNTALMRLCLDNYAKQVSPGHFCRRRSEP